MSVKKLFDLAGKTALVTGGSRGLGLQIAEALGEMGARLVLSARKADELQAATSKLIQLGIDAQWIAADAANPADALAASDLYSRLPELDFSRHVLEGSEKFLRVHPVPACGWSDLGTPKRVGEALRRLEREDRAASLSLAPTAYLNLAAQHARLRMAM